MATPIYSQGDGSDGLPRVWPPGRRWEGSMHAHKSDVRTHFAREPAGLRHCPALALNSDDRPLSYYPRSLRPWQEAIKAVFLDRVTIIAEYEEVVRSQKEVFRIPSIVVLKDYVKPQKRVAFTRFNLFGRDEISCQYCGAKCDLTFDHVVPRSRGDIASRLNLRPGQNIPRGLNRYLENKISRLTAYCSYGVRACRIAAICTRRAVT